MEVYLRFINIDSLQSAANSKHTDSNIDIELQCGCGLNCVSKHQYVVNSHVQMVIRPYITRNIGVDSSPLHKMIVMRESSFMFMQVKRYRSDYS